MIELEPREPVPAHIDAHIEASGEDGQSIRGQLQSIPVGIEDLFVKSPVPDDVSEGAVAEYYSTLFNALWESCESPENIGRETFPLKGGKGVVAIHGTGSVKLLEAQSNFVIEGVEQFLAPFVVAVSGYKLVNIVKDDGIIEDVIQKDEESTNPSHEEDGLIQEGPLQLEYFEYYTNGDDSFQIAK